MTIADFFTFRFLRLLVNLAGLEKQHFSVRGNALRAAVLGGNDGLVSNFSLVLGIAEARSVQEAVLLLGLAILWDGHCLWLLGIGSAISLFTGKSIWYSVLSKCYLALLPLTLYWGLGNGLEFRSQVMGILRLGLDFKIH